MTQITKTWSITAVECYSEVAGEQNVVFTIGWLLTGTDGVHLATIYGVVNIPISSGTPFTPYADLTEAQVIGWAQSAMGAEQVAAYEANLTLQIENLINPPVVTPPLPWSA